MRGKIQPPKAGIAPVSDELPALQEVGAQGHIHSQFPHKVEATLHFRREKRWIYRAQTRR
jgi:hypothetical protein